MLLRRFQASFPEQDENLTFRLNVGVVDVIPVLLFFKASCDAGVSDDVIRDTNENLEVRQKYPEPIPRKRVRVWCSSFTCSLHVKYCL